MKKEYTSLNDKIASLLFSQSGNTKHTTDAIKPTWTPNMALRLAVLSLVFADLKNSTLNGAKLFKTDPFTMPLPSEVKQVALRYPMRAIKAMPMIFGEDYNAQPHLWEEDGSPSQFATKTMASEIAWRWGSVWREWAMIKQVAGQALREEEQAAWDSGEGQTFKTALIQGLLAGTPALAKDPALFDQIKEEVVVRYLTAEDTIRMNTVLITINEEITEEKAQRMIEKEYKYQASLVALCADLIQTVEEGGDHLSWLRNAGLLH